MNKNHFERSLSRADSLMHEKSSRANIKDLHQRTNWGRNRGAPNSEIDNEWYGSSEFDKPGETLEVLEDAIELPFDPEDKNRKDIRDALTDVSSFQTPTQERIYRHAKEFYTKEDIEINTLDVVDICQILQYAQENEHDDWIKPLDEKVENFFEGVEDSPIFLRQGDDTGIEELSLEKIREYLENRHQSLREATKEVYGPPDEEPHKKLIEEAQKSYLWILLSNTEDFNNLPSQ